MARLWTVSFLILFINATVSHGAQNCLDFDGSDQVDIDHDASLNMGTGGITIEAWIKTSADTPSGYFPRIVSKDRYGNGRGFNLFIAHNSNKIAFEIWYDGNWYGVWGYVVNDGNWHHVIGRRSGTRVSVFKDGSEMAMTYPGASSNINNSATLTLANSEAGDAFFTGKIDEVRIWNTARSIEDIERDMFKELDGTEPGLKAYFQFNESSGTVLPDLTSNGNDGTLTGMNPAEDWIGSVAPIATETTEDLLDVRGVWAGKKNNFSSIMTIRDLDLSGADRIVFGHTPDTLAFGSQNVPPGLMSRISRVWRIEEWGDLVGDVIFDISGYGSRNEYFRVLVDNDEDFSDATILAGLSTSSDFTVSNHSFMDTCFYTLALAGLDTMALEVELIAVDTVRVSWDLIAGATEFDLYRSLYPFFSTSGTPWQTVVSPMNYVDSSDGVEDPDMNYYIIGRARNTTHTSSESNTVGDFEYDLP